MRKIYLLVVLLFCTSAFAQTSQPVTDPDPTVAINQLRTELTDSFNKGDLPRLLSHLDPDVVITWQNGEICRGPDEVKAYYEKMMKGPDRRVMSVNANPSVTDRHVYGDWAVSWGEMHDRFVLTDGGEMAFNSKFTATIARRGQVWKVTSFHLSVNAFDNAILHYAVRKIAMWTTLIALPAGLLIGFLVGRLPQRKANA